VLRSATGASNCVVDRRVNGSILPKKEHKDSPKKIDGMDALIMAIGGSAAGDDRSAYDADDRAEEILHV
jgi:phage terminase large subunit-like protein